MAQRQRAGDCVGTWSAAKDHPPVLSPSLHNDSPESESSEVVIDVSSAAGDQTLVIYAKFLVRRNFGNT